MLTTRYLIAIVFGLLLGIWVSHTSLLQTAHSQETKKQEKEAVKTDAKTATPKKETHPPEEDPDLKELRMSATEFEKAYNDGDAKSLAVLFAENAEVVDEDENLVAGRANIEARFAEVFKEFPQAKIEVDVASIRKLSANVAIEEGSSTVTLKPDTVPSVSPYAIVHIKRDGKWKFASVRDFPEEFDETPRDHLNELAWLVGDWVDESREGRVETKCRWSEDGNYLLQDYAIKTRDGDELKGTQRIGWDPLRGTVRAWVFDNSGGFVESTWTNVDGNWITKITGTTADGDSVSATRVLTQLTDEAYLIESTSQIVGDELLPDSVVKVVRQAPLPDAP